MTNRASKNSLTRSKHIIVACCAAIAMILGAMSVGATRSGTTPTDDAGKPILLNEDTSYTGGGSNGASHTYNSQPDELSGLQLLSANVSRPYTEPSPKNSKTADLNVLLGANPIRLNVSADSKGLQIKLDAGDVVQSSDTGSTTPETTPTDTTPTIQDPIPTDTTTSDPPASGDSGTTPGTDNSSSTDLSSAIDPTL